MENTSLETIQVSTCLRFREALHNHKAIWTTYLDSVFISINVILCIATIMGNMLILVALQKNSVLHPPSKLLFRCLASTDLCVGLISQPLFVSFLVSLERDRLKMCHVNESLVLITSFILCGMSLCTLTAISVDRLLALLLGLKYRQVVTLARVRGFTTATWIVSFLVGMLYFWSKRVFLSTISFGAVLFLVASTFCYSKIYFTICYRQAQIWQQSEHGELNFSTRTRVLMYKRTVTTSLWVSFSMIACYLPFSIVQFVINMHPEDLGPLSSVVAEGSMASLVFFNSSINPLIYCWRIREIRQSVKATIRRFWSICF